MLRSVSEGAGKVEHVAIFEAARGPRLLEAEQFLLGWPELFGGPLAEARLGFAADTQHLFAIARFDADHYNEQVAARFGFWAERVGGNELALAELDLRSRANLLTRIEQCAHQRAVSNAGALGAAFDELLTAAGITRGQRGDRVGLCLEADLSRPFAFRWDAAAQELMVLGDRLLPTGDRVQLALSVPTERETFSAWGQVVEPRERPPEGVSLKLLSPSPALKAALARLPAAPQPVASSASDRRTAVRFPLKAPVKFNTTQTVRLGYASPESALADYTENLSLGGAFIRTQRPPRLGTALTLELDLPNGPVLHAPAIVVSRLPIGMGIEFRLDPWAKDALVRYIGHLVAPHPEALELFRVKFATREQLAAERAALLLSGVFLPTERTLALQTEVQVELELPDGSTHVTGGTVVSTDSRGVGLQLHGETAALLALHQAVLRLVGPAHVSDSRISALDLAEEPPPYIEHEGRVRVGDYEALSLLGSGGMAEVFHARALQGPRAGEYVALKRLKPAMEENPQAVELFIGEGDILGRLDHPNIIKTYDTGTADGRRFIVMELVDGRDLSQIFRRCRQRGILLPVDFVCFVVQSLLDALACAHGARGPDGKLLNLVHCDVSPSNVFISRAGEIKLGDFGLARPATPGAEGDIVGGKPSYLSPEAIDGEVSVSIDLWATLVTLYEGLTLELPFQGVTPEEKVERIQAVKWTSAGTLRPGLPPALDAVFGKGFAKAPKKRFQSVDELSAALDGQFDRRAETQRAIAALVRGLFDVVVSPAPSGD